MRSRIACAALFSVVATSHVSSEPLSLQWEWDGNVESPSHPSIRSSVPLVLQLSDDDANGVIDDRDTPDVVFVARNVTAHTNMLVAVDGRSGATLWSVAIPYTKAPSLAAGDINGDGV